MSFSFNPDEVYEIAEKIEINGSEFYRKAAESVSEKHYQDLLNELADMELDHYETFSDMQKALSGTEKETTTLDPDEESQHYLTALADSELFPKKELDFSSIKSILRDAIDLEKASILFYLGMKDLMASVQGKARLDEIIGEERKHIVRLAKELKQL